MLTRVELLSCVALGLRSLFSGLYALFGITVLYARRVDSLWGSAIIRYILTYVGFLDVLDAVHAELKRSFFPHGIFFDQTICRQP